MKFSKRFIAVMMIVTIVFITGTQNEVSYASNNKTASSIDFLAGIGFWDADTAGIETETSVSRGDFVVLLTKLLLTDEDSGLNTTEFKDVDESAEYADEVAILHAMGAISADENGFFNADQNITGAQAVKILVELLGYGYKAQSMGGYPLGYLSVASMVGLTYGVRIDGEITFGDAAVLIGNALKTDIARNTKIGRTIEYKIENGYTLMEDRLGILSDKGRMVSNSQTGLNYSIPASDTYVMIDDLLLKSNIDCDKYLGYRVEFFYKGEEGDKEKELLYLTPLGSNVSVELLASDIVSFDNMKYTIEEQNKNVEYELGRSIDVIYNQKAYQEYTSQDLVPRIGAVTLLDSDDDGIYETVFIKSVSDYVVSSITGEGLIYDLLQKNALDVDDSDKETTITQGGEVVSYDVIQKYDVLSVMESKNTKGKKAVSIEISNKTAAGSVDELGSDNTIVIGGAEYKLSEQLIEDLENESIELAPLTIKKNIVAYFNIYGEIAYYKSETTEGEFYGYVIKAAVSQGIRNKVQMRVINSEGIWSTLDVKKKISIDGVPSSGLDIIKALTENNKIKPQLIRYTVSSDGLVDMLDTAVTTGSEDAEECLTGSAINASGAKLTYKRSSRTFDGIFSISNKCVVFGVPGAGFEDDESLYQAGNAGYFTEGVSYVVRPYKVSDAKVADVVIVEGAGADADIAQDAKLFLVESVSKVLESEAETIRISGLLDGAKFSAVVKDSDIKMFDRPDQGIKKDCSNINKGDVIRIGQDANGKIINIERLINMKLFKQNSATGVANKFSGGGGYRDGYSVRGGWVYARTEDIIAVTDTPQQDITIPDIQSKLLTYSAQTPKITYYDMQTERARAGTIDDIATYKVTNSVLQTSFVYIHAMNGDPKGLIIFKR